MLATALFSLLLAAFARSESRDASFTLIESRVLADGNTIHRIQEHADELPELLSIPELEDEIAAKEEEVLVPVDEKGKVLPEFEHLVKPHVVEISREQILRMNNSRVKDGLVIMAPQSPFIVASSVHENKPNEDREMETAGADYDEAAVPDSQLPIPNDYENSKEKDLEVETGDDGLREKELEKIEMEIEQRKGAEEVVPLEVLEDISAITREAEEELAQEVKREEEERKEVQKAAEEILAVVSDDVISEETNVEEEKKAVEEAEEEIRNEEKEGGINVAEVKKEGPAVAEISVIEREEVEESKDENQVAKGAAEGARLLEGGNLESLEEEEPEPEHRPSRPLRGEVIFRRGRPDSAQSQKHSLFLFLMIFIFLF